MPEQFEPNGQGRLDGKECAHCGLWYRMSEAKPVPGKNAIRCPYCDWMVEGVEQN